jgi:hypothetical protein
MDNTRPNDSQTLVPSTQSFFLQPGHSPTKTSSFCAHDGGGACSDEDGNSVRVSVRSFERISLLMTRLGCLAVAAATYKLDDQENLA